MSLLRNFLKQSSTIVLITCFVLFFAGQCQANAGDRTVEYKIKAAYLYNFLKFVKWSDSNLTEDEPEITICLLGHNQLAPFLEPVTQMKAQGRSIRVDTISNLSQARDCQLLFISDTATKNLPKIMPGLKAVNYLTVGDIENFAAKGGMVGFVMKEGKVKLEINNRAAKLANVRISAKLLEIAKIVQ